MTNWRSAQWPISAATLTPRLPRRRFRYSGKVVQPHCTPARNAGSDIASTRSKLFRIVSRSCSLQGARAKAQLPGITVVTPWKHVEVARGSHYSFESRCILKSLITGYTTKQEVL